VKVLRAWTGVCLLFLLCDADMFQIKVLVLNRVTGRFDKHFHTIDRVKLSGSVGKAFRGVIGLCFQSGWVSVVSSVVLWVQAFASTQLGYAVAVAPFAYIAVGFFLGLIVLELDMLLDHVYKMKYLTSSKAAC
jgi:hypothetical protein